MLGEEALVLTHSLAPQKAMIPQLLERPEYMAQTKIGLKEFFAALEDNFQVTVCIATLAITIQDLFKVLANIRHKYEMYQCKGASSPMNATCVDVHPRACSYVIQMDQRVVAAYRWQ